METTLSDDSAVFLDDFGESITFIPRSGTKRTITAIVDRDIPVRTQGGSLLSVIRITVANDNTLGISSATVNGRGADRVEVAERIGGEIKNFGVYIVGEGMIGTQDAGMVSYELR